jgi:hypothetical protein
LNKTLLLVATALLFCLPAAAQTTPAWEVFGGYSYARVDLTDITHVDANGWSASATDNVNSWFGGMLEVNGYYATPQFVFDGEIFKPNSSVYTALYGPKFSYRRNSRFTPFGYVLLGGAVLQGSQSGFSASNASFAAAPGGGVDVRVSDLAAVRVQGDYTYTNFRSFQLATDPTSGIDHLVLTGPRIRQNNFRITVGIVLRIGEK